MTAKAIEKKDAPPSSRPLPPTPKAAPATAVAKQALKGPARVRYPSPDKSIRPLSGNLRIPADPNELTRMITKLVDQASDPTRRENSLKSARELLDEVFLEIFLSDDDYQTRQTWLNSLRLGYNSILSFATYHNIEASEARLVLLCNKIMKQIELELRTEATETPAVSEPLDLFEKSSSRWLTWKIVKISLAIFAIAGLLFTARTGIHRFRFQK
jgi:hypothetical protein